MTEFGPMFDCEECGAVAGQDCEPWCKAWNEEINHKTPKEVELGTYCGQCWEDWDKCRCDEQTAVETTNKAPMCDCIPSKRFYCATCGVSRTLETDYWDWCVTSPGYTNKASAPGILPGYKSDRHWFETLAYPDGNEVIACSHGTRPQDTPLPDFALYLDDCWLPKSLAMYLPWQDYGLPTIDLDRAVWTISHAWEWIKNGNRVEVGCIGGHGRTGTVLACFAVLAGVPAADAVEWVRTNYCRKAVETDRQAWFVLYFAAAVGGYDPPPMPEIPVHKTSGTWTKNADGTWTMKKDKGDEGGETAPLALTDTNGDLLTVKDIVVQAYAKETK